MIAPWLLCVEADPATTTSWWGTFPQWLAFVGTIAATTTAVWIALRQRAAEERVLAGRQREKAAHVALESLDEQGVTVRNHSQTPVTNVRLVTVEAYVDEDLGEDEGWTTVGRTRATVEPGLLLLLSAGDGARFTFTGWHSPEELTPDSSQRRGNPSVTFAYTDAAGTRWQRENYDLPVPWGGVPLPGAAAERRRIVRRKRWRRWGRRRRIIWKSLRFGLRCKGFTLKGRQKRRAKLREKEKAQQRSHD
ncbi:hypothetical protein [Streptomyces sp. NPDC029674]|uniref:hypothetical protein n=1 Tax=Streptomyces sp. NPDC029674 TaxID=3365297 RepID=UPI00384C6D58